MEQSKEEVPEVREEEEEKEETVMAVSGTSEPNEGLGNSAPSARYTGRLEKDINALETLKGAMDMC